MKKSFCSKVFNTVLILSMIMAILPGTGFAAANDYTQLQSLPLELGDDTEDPPFSAQVIGEIDTGTKFNGRDTLVLDWQLTATRAGLTLNNTQGLRLVYDNTVLQLIRWDATNDYDSYVGNTLSTMSRAGNTFGIFTGTMSIYGSKNVSGNIGYLSLTVGSGGVSKILPVNEYETLLQIRFAFREGKSEADLALGSIRVMALEDLITTNQSSAMLINTIEASSYMYLPIEGKSTLEKPILEYPINAQPPLINTHPVSAAVNVGASHTLNVVATSSDGGTLGYQWYSNSTDTNSGGNPIADATNSSYTPTTSTTGEYYYYVVVTNTIPDNGYGGTKTAYTNSIVVTLVVNTLINAQLPVITFHPASATVNIGASHALNVVANSPDGGTLGYQWYSNTIESASGGTAIIGATEASYYPLTSTEGAYYYYAVVTNTIIDNGDGGTKNATRASNAVTLTLSKGGGSSSGGGSQPKTATLRVKAIDKATSAAILTLPDTTPLVGEIVIIPAPAVPGYTLVEGYAKTINHTVKEGMNIIEFFYNKAGEEPVLLPPDDRFELPVSDKIKTALETEEHIRYINGYPDGSVKPDGKITRAEVAIIFWRLLKAPDKNDPVAITFKDIKGNEAYAQAVKYLAKIDILHGYEDGSFRPSQGITRAEFVAIASRFDDLGDNKTNPFTDLAGSHWAYAYIISAYMKGWIGGYPDGEFKPQNSISRAEVVKIVNCMLGRGIKQADLPEGLPNYTDLSNSHWAYSEIMEATVSHEYERKADGWETWK